MQDQWIAEATIEQLQKALDERRLTSTELVAYYFQRIAMYDKAGPSLQSVMEINPDAFHIAEALDAERAAI